MNRATESAPEDPLADPHPWSTPALHRLVTNHGPADRREEQAKQRFLEELARLATPCSETADPVHVTASAIVVGERGTILHKHRRLGRWMQPGGHIDPNEAPADAALRESQEETGLVLHHVEDGPRVVHLDVHEAANGHVHLDLRYLLVGPSADPDPPEGESPDARWFTWDEAEARCDEALIEGLRVARRIGVGRDEDRMARS